MIQLNITCCLLLLILLINFILCKDNDVITNSTILNRKRRYLLFPKGARNGIRVNFKHNRVVPITSILAFSDGMRLTWDLPTKVDDLRPKFKRSEQQRDVFKFIEQILVTYGMDGEACIMRALCETTQQQQQKSLATGIVRKILHLIFMVQENEENKYVYYDDHQACQRSIHKCPFSLLGPSVVSPLHEINPLD